MFEDSHIAHYLTSFLFFYRRFLDRDDAVINIVGRDGVSNCDIDYTMWPRWVTHDTIRGELVVFCDGSPIATNRRVRVIYERIDINSNLLY